MKLLRVDYDTATRIAGLDVSRADLDELQEMLASLDAKAPKVDDHPLQPFPKPPGVFRLRPRGKRSQPFLRYLEKRNLPRECVDRYQICGSDHPRSEWRDRVCFPVCTPDREQIGLTGRHIGKHPQRYHTRPKAVDRCLFNAENAHGGTLLVLCEGPLDALTLDWAAHVNGLPANAVAMMGLNVSVPQAFMLQALAERYDETVLAPDPGALARGLELQKELPCEISVAQLPPGVDDPGALTPRQAHSFLKKLLTS
jgi:DNA primase